MIDPSRPATCNIHHLYADPDESCRGRYIRLVIHPDVEDLRAAATAYDKRRGHRSQDLSDTAGLFQSTPFRSRYDRRTKTWIDTTPPFAGIMRLANGYLTDEIIAHESTHAALHITRLHDWAKPGANGDADFGDNCDDREEAFAYLLGGIAAEVSNIVHRYQEGQQ